MKLRVKIFSGFLILTTMLFLAGVISILEFTSISSTVEDLLEDNYKSVNASKEMIEALEREDSGILTLLLGNWSEGKNIIMTADSNFVLAFKNAKNNITIENEDQYIAEIEAKYMIFKNKWEMPIVGTKREGNINWYTTEVLPAFLEVKTAVKALMTLNDRTMFETSTMLRTRAKKSIMPGIVAIVAAIIFSLMFIFFINLYVVTPILKMTRGIRDFLDYNKPFRLEVDTRDEIMELANSINNLINNILKVK
jgi:methyl-accepting chemotaxis protein